MVEEIYTDIERIVLQWLINNNIVFQFQTSLGGGFYSLGGAVVDFIIPDRRLAFRVMGEYYHRSVSATGKDLIQKETLTAQGFTVVDLWGDDLKFRLELTMQLALQGQEMLR